MNGSGDAAVGPQYKSQADFTLTFEHGILTMIPAALVIIGSLCVLNHYRKEPKQPSSDSQLLLFLRLGTSALLFVADAIALGFWNSIPTEGYRSDIAIAAAALSCTATLFITVVLFVEYRRSLHTTATISLYLAVAIVADMFKSRTYFTRPNLPGIDRIGVICVVDAVLKAVLLVLEEIPKTSKLGSKHLRLLVGRESLSGYWNRSLFIWLNSTLFFGFRNIIGVEDLDNLGPDFDEEKLLADFRKVWDKVDKKSDYALAIACLRAYWTSFFIIVPPRLCYIAFTFVQPYLLQKILVAFRDGTLFDFENGLIVATGIVFFGIGTTRASYTHYTYRFIARMRGAFLQELYDKMLLIPQSEAERSAAVTLMSTEIDCMILGLDQFHDIWAAFVEIGIRIWLLTTMIDASSFLVGPPTVISTWVAYEIGKRMSPARSAWNSFIESRVSNTSNVLSQIKGWKMIGMGPILADYLQNLRKEEMVFAKLFRRLTAAMLSSAMFMNSATPIIVIAGALFWTKYQTHLSADEIFPLMAILYLVQDPLANILMYYPNVMSTLACVRRIQNFLLLGEIQHVSESEAAPASSQAANDEKAANCIDVSHRRLRAPAPTTDQHVVEFLKASIAPEKGKTAVLSDVSIDIPREALAMLSGPTGSGKTTLLRSIIGGADVPEGSLRVDPSIGYCAQEPWIQNVSVRQNIISEYSFEPERYNRVVKACMLLEDFRNFPGGDQFLAGSGGVNLSGGQKHRVGLARALYSEARVVVLDDIFKALDRRTAATIFCNLFGRDGLLTKSKVTVIMATSATAEWLNLATDVISINADGKVNVATNSRRPSLSDSELFKLLAPTDGDDETEAAKDAEEAEADPPGAAQIQNDSVAELEEETDRLRQTGSRGIYRFYLQAASWMSLTLLLSLTSLVSLSERLPQIYMRIWIEKDPDNMLYFIGFALIAVVSGLATLANLYHYWFHFVPESAEGMHKLLVNVVMSAKLSFLTSTDSGAILNRFSQDMTLLAQDLPLTFWKCIYLSFFVILDIGVLVSGVTYAAAVIPFLVGTLYIVQRYYLRTSRQIRHLDLEAKTPLYTLFTETSAGLEHIRCFGWQEKFIARNAKLLRSSQKPLYHMFALQRWLGLVMDMLALGLALTVVSLVIKLRRIATPAGFGLTFLNIITIGAAMTSLVKRWTEMETSLGAIERLRSFIKKTPVEKDKTAFAPVPESWPQRGHIVMDDVSVKYHETDDRPVLRNVSLDFGPGKKAAIVGRTGSDKSSIITTILNFLDYTGSIQIDGVELSQAAPDAVRSRITTVTQDRVALNGTVRDNIIPEELLLPLNEKTDTSVIVEALRQVGLADHFEGRLDAPMADVGMSVGQGQQFGIARAMIHHGRTGSKIVLLDEPTSSMGEEEDAAMHKVMADAFAGCTVVTVTHRLETVVNRQVVVEMENGSVAGCTEVDVEA